MMRHERRDSRKTFAVLTEFMYCLLVIIVSHELVYFMIFVRVIYADKTKSKLLTFICM